MREAPAFTRIDVCTPLEGLKIASRSSSRLAELVDNANMSARESAAKRLRALIPVTAIEALPRYFEHSMHYEATCCGNAAENRWTTDRLVHRLCMRPQTLVVGKKAQGLQIGISGNGIVGNPTVFGMQVEPDSDVFLLDPSSIFAAAMQNASVEVRLLDRHNSDWASVADDIVAVSGADVFLKLFVAGGAVSVNDWHRDASDVLAVLLDGTKLFEVASADSTDHSRSITVSALMRPGDTLLLPRGRLHKATPTGEISSLLSIGLMRCGDWFYRGAPPTHLGLNNPRSPLLYRLMLHPRSPPTWGPGRDRLRTLYRSRIPGGIGLTESGGPGLRFLAGGKLWASDTDALELLAEIHRGDGISSDELSEVTGRDKASCAALAEDAVEAGLAYTSIPTR
jgi:hypothetical protein